MVLGSIPSYFFTININNNRSVMSNKLENIDIFDMIGNLEENGYRFCGHCNGYGSSLKESAPTCTKCKGTGLEKFKRECPCPDDRTGVSWKDNVKTVSCIDCGKTKWATRVN